MGMFFALLSLAAVLAPIAAFVAFARTVSLRRRVDAV
jgi:hypothetical protein